MRSFLSQNTKGSWQLFTKHFSGQYTHLEHKKSVCFLFSDPQYKFVFSHHSGKSFHSRNIKILSGRFLSVGPTEVVSLSVAG